MTHIPVTYLCYGCGSQKVEYEEQEEPIPEKVIWNLCPQCLKNKERLNNMDRSILGKNVTDFNEVDPFNDNRLEGVICHDNNEYYGSIFLERVNGKSCPQLIMGSPKMHYPFDKAGIYRFPPAHYIEVFEKLDGTNILAYRYTDGNSTYITYKTRLNPILKSGRFGDFLSMWREVLAEYGEGGIKWEMEQSECNLSFELYGSQNTILVRYKEPLTFRLLFGVRNNGQILSPTQLHNPDVPTLPILFTIDKSFQEKYLETREVLESKLKVTDDGYFEGQEGTVWYCHLDNGMCVQIKCKPETIEAIHFASGAHMGKNSILVTIWNALENTDNITHDLVATLLAEEYDQHEIEANRHLIDNCINTVTEELFFREKVLTIYKSIALDINTNKQEVMRAMTPHFTKNLMGKVYSIISNYKERDNGMQNELKTE